MLNLALIAAVFTIAGCGGGSGNTASVAKSAPAGASSNAVPVSSATPVRALSKPELIAAAEPICTRLNTALVAARENVRTKQDMIRIAQRRAPLEQSTVTELSKLTPPRSLAHDWRRILATRETIVEDINQVMEDARAGNLEGARSVLIAGGAVQNQMRTMAKRDGFKECAHIG
jgi:hypothetical protein